MTIEGEARKRFLGYRMTRLLEMTMIVVVSCSRGGTLSGPVAIISDEETGAPTIEELAQASYRGIFEESITLVDGRWEGKAYVEGGASRPSIGLIGHFELTGDLDGDGRSEAAAVLWESSGGSGNRLYLAAMGRREEVIENLGTALIGDRVQIRAGEIIEGLVTLDIVRAGPEDAACCPTEKALVSWTLSGNDLVRIDEEVTGTLSLSDLAGPEWVLLELGRGQALPDGMEITLAFEDERASGSGACNRYFAGVGGPASGEIIFSGMGATRRACPEPMMDIERRYLQALAGASRYGFLVGRLVLSCRTGEGPLTLTYAPRSSTTP